MMGKLSQCYFSQDSDVYGAMSDEVPNIAKCMSLMDQCDSTQQFKILYEAVKSASGILENYMPSEFEGEAGIKK